MNKFLTGVSLFALIFLLACGDDSVSTEQEHHLEPVAIALENHESEEILAILFDEEALPDSVSRSAFSLSVADTLEVHVINLCEENGTLIECDLHADEHNHDAEAEAEDHDHTDDTTDVHEHTDEHDHSADTIDTHDHTDEHDHSDETTAEYTLQATISDTSVVELEVHSEEFELHLVGKQAGSSDLTLEIWHGTHTDIAGKVFQITVEE